MRVLLIEDDPTTAKSIELMLGAEGFNVYTTDLGEEGLDLGKLYDYDIICLDLHLPDMHGYDVLMKLRAAKVETAVLILSVRSEMDSKMRCFGLGADDYVTKPYRLKELVARMRAVLRRQSKDEDAGEAFEVGVVFAEGGVHLDLNRHELRVDNKFVPLALKEFELLAYLMENSGRVVTRESLMQNVWGYDYLGDTKTIDVHIKRLRSKIEVDPSEPSLITTVRGVGYRFERKQTAE